MQIVSAHLHIISIGYLLFSILVALYLFTWMSHENRRRDLVTGQFKYVA